METTIITPGISASSKGMCVKQVKGRARRGGCFEGGSSTGKQGECTKCDGGGGEEGDLSVAGREYVLPAQVKFTSSVSSRDLLFFT